MPTPHGILIGTSGYSYDDWVGPVYPSGTAKSEFLRLYAQRFAFTELNFTYYRLPSAKALAGMSRKTPEGFQFAVKAHQSLTHEAPSDWEEQAHAFATAVSELDASGKLLGVLLQFPYRFHYTKENRRYLGALCRRLGRLPLILEFRNTEWFTSSVYEEMRDRGLSLVVPDMPELRGLPYQTRESSDGGIPITGPLSYVRMHGRNRDTWWTGDNVTRYDYQYSLPELREWIPLLRDAQRRSERVVVSFNNHARGQAVVNAEQLQALLSESA
jgi:uncharacterized protein YecE (DUF72 family)